MQRLRQRADFVAAAAGRKVVTQAFVLQARERADDGPIRVGFTVSRKNGTATERNRIRRRLREVVRRTDGMALQPHHDYVLVGRRAALSRDFAVMVDDFRNCLQRLGRDQKRGARKPD